VSLHHLDVEQRDAEIGYWSSPDARGRGVLRESDRYADGDYHDEHLHAILASEWREMIAR